MRATLLSVVCTAVVASECPGSCINTATDACSTGPMLTGLCPGQASVQCCPANCVGDTAGTCIDTSAASCETGATFGGLCPGSAAVRCCPVRSNDRSMVAFPQAQRELSLNYRKVQGTALGRSYTAHVAVLGDPRYFGVEPQPGGCANTRVATSVAARHYSCEYATNAGYFSYTAGIGCIGGVVVNGTRDASPAVANRASLALLRNESYAVGFLDQTHGDDDYWQLIEGLGWIVREGRPYSDQSEDLADRRSIADAVTPRTAVGVTSSGELILAQTEGIEGAEGSVGVTGTTLMEFATLLVNDFDVVEAVNMDGGGSSDSVYRGEVVGNPTCHGTTEICERDVASITCVYRTPIYNNARDSISV